ncbi:DUF6090 family protein [Cognatitamlana onchidii]|uniref:DUF6090 family protein n=1 Tax=Cognatitamlana onchidii TaxID=2562860 RepID=UPI0010A66433|nr:DUF6090 family protein [Algibacter onchidii]
MIKFFRKIRQKLLAQSKFKSYLFYAIGEIVLVVIGILIALQINNWNEHNKLETKKQEYFFQLLEDLKKDKEFCHITIERFKENRRAYKDYVQEFYTTKLSPEMVYSKLLALSRPSTNIVFNQSTIETLQNSGEIALIPSNLRNRLIDLRRSQNRIVNNSRFNNNGKNNILQKTSLLIGNFELEGRIEKQQELKSFFNLDHNRKEIILGIEAMHAWKSFSEKTTLTQLEDLLKQIAIIEDLINESIKN